ncbi:Gfo/Idh/MocA family protein [Gemmatimonas sp.]|uniref:Gfo/Idh/MocA family protein n=1 Tax=Gemmatimonas sp. TaxID=1962908 RepID=UPI003DA66A05
MSDSFSRRDFVGTSATLAMGAMIVPRHVLGGQGFRAPSDTLNIACVGIGGMGMSNMSQMLTENIVAVCDVDFGYVERSLAGRLKPREGQPTPENVLLGEKYTKAAKYADFREMLAKQKDIDAVMIATPDHLHATIALAAMSLGKHVYVQKPLAFSVYEARLLQKAAANNPTIATQMGNQGHSMAGSHRVTEIVRSGVLGKVHDVHVWTDRPVRYWAQGIPRPRPAGAAVVNANPRPQWNMGTVDNAVRNLMASNDHSPPEGFNWDLYLGPAPEIPYHPAYHPFAWRGWLDFGVGAIGDMGAHLIDQAYTALELTYPTSITASSSPWGGGEKNPATYPLAMMAQFEYPAVGKRGPVKLHWYDGGLLPPRPDMLPVDAPISNPGSDGGGAMIVGEKGILIHETYGNRPRIYPEGTARKAEQVAQSIPRITVSHEQNWIQASKGQTKSSSPFSQAAPLTETMLLGIAALRAGQGRKVLYNAEKMEFTNAPEANQYLTRAYRKGWQP